MEENELLQLTNKGLYCRAGDFYVDPWQPVKRAAKPTQETSDTELTFWGMVDTFDVHLRQIRKAQGQLAGK